MATVLAIRPNRPSRPLRPAVVRGLLAVLAVVVAGPLAYVLLGGSLGGADAVYRQHLATAATVVAAVAATWRPIAVSRDRLPWGLLAAGSILYASGQVLWAYHLEEQLEPPFPSAADGLWLAAYPMFLAGVAVLARRRRIGAPGARVWLDAIGAGAGLASVVAAVAFATIISGAADLEGLALAADLAYPVLDLLLLGLMVASLALEGWRFDWSRLLLAGGAGILAITDTSYSLQLAQGEVPMGAATQGGYALGLLALAASAWAPARTHAARTEGPLTLLPPVVATASAVGVLVAGNAVDISPLAVALAAVAVLAALGRTALGYRELAELARTRVEALTDELTGLANRRQLFRSLEDVLSAGEPAVLVLFDLDGFKGYNDRHGHVEGDRLLARLGRALVAEVEPAGRAFRLGGDEFCILAPGRDVAPALVAAADAAVERAGDGSEVGVSAGTVLLPDEARDADGALRLADARMYALKGERAGSLRRAPRTH